MRGYEETDPPLPGMELAPVSTRAHPRGLRSSCRVAAAGGRRQSSGRVLAPTVIAKTLPEATVIKEVPVIQRRGSTANATARREQSAARRRLHI